MPTSSARAQLVGRPSCDHERAAWVQHPRRVFRKCSEPEGGTTLADLEQPRLLPLYHFSAVPIGPLCRYSPTSDNEHKPGGLWLSDESEYGWFCLLKDRLASGEPGWSDATEEWQYMTLVEVNLQSVLTVTNEAEMGDFVRMYGEPEQRACNDGFGLHIDWQRVKIDYQGMLFSPYQDQYSHRHQDPVFHWNRLDCASACIWDTCGVVLKIHESRDAWAAGT